MRVYLFFLSFIFSPFLLFAQGRIVSGFIKSESSAVPFAAVTLGDKGKGVITDEQGFFSITDVMPGTYLLRVSSLGFNSFQKKIRVDSLSDIRFDVELSRDEKTLKEVVVSGTLKEISRIESPVPVEVYSPSFLKKNPTPSIFEALQNVNGVRPQINCNVCNTGDIHINGLEGPYTMVMIDGMPIVSSLSTVYGLSGIPNSLIERVEIVKGPASSLYGSEAVGGLINIITKKPSTAPRLSFDVSATTWQEFSNDIGFKLNAGKVASVLTGVNHYRYKNPIDNNKDGFTDVTLQERVSVFQKWSFNRPENRVFTLGGRLYYEDRWGGEMNWDKRFRGGDSIYGESIYTGRGEMIGSYQLPFKEKIMLSGSYNYHDQNSVYGTTIYKAAQQVGFSQVTWDKKVNDHDLLAGAALRYTWYEDNTAATEDTIGNRPDSYWLPGIFLQDEIALHDRHKVLLGYRYDYNSRHGNIHTPRFAYKFKFNEKNIFRLNFGTGYRVVNIFAEDHAALTGARKVVIKEELDPERSLNLNLNYMKKVCLQRGGFLGFDVSAWYTYFHNRIVPDYLTDVNSIYYDNLDGYAVSKGVSSNVDLAFPNGLKVLAGVTLMDVYSTEENGTKVKQLLTENYSGTWAISYTIKPLKVDIDYTGNLYGPMDLPVLGPLDPRKATSDPWSLQNIQLTYKGFRGFEIYGGVKNILNWTPARNNPFIIARSSDPFDKNVSFDLNGNAVPTSDNVHGLTFDPTYVYGPNQGIRGFLGVRYSFY